MDTCLLDCMYNCIGYDDQLIEAVWVNEKGAIMLWTNPTEGGIIDHNSSYYDEETGKCRGYIPITEEPHQIEFDSPKWTGRVR